MSRRRSRIESVSAHADRAARISGILRCGDLRPASSRSWQQPKDAVSLLVGVSISSRKALKEFARPTIPSDFTFADRSPLRNALKTPSNQTGSKISSKNRSSRTRPLGAPWLPAPWLDDILKLEAQACGRVNAGQVLRQDTLVRRGRRRLYLLAFDRRLIGPRREPRQRSTTCTFRVTRWRPWMTGIIDLQRHARVTSAVPPAPPNST